MRDHIHADDVAITVQRGFFDIEFAFRQPAGQLRRDTAVCRDARLAVRLARLGFRFLRRRLAGKPSSSRACFHRQRPWIACWSKDGALEIWQHDLLQRIAIITVPTDCDVRDLSWNENLTAITRDDTLLTWHMPPAGQDHYEMTTSASLSATQRATFGLPPSPSPA
jgi:hypothetical protein